MLVVFREDLKLIGLSHCFMPVILWDETQPSTFAPADPRKQHDGL